MSNIASDAGAQLVLMRNKKAVFEYVKGRLPQCEDQNCDERTFEQCASETVCSCNRTIGVNPICMYPLIQNMLLINNTLTHVSF